MFDAQPTGKLSRAKIGRPIGRPRIGNGVRQCPALRQLGRDHRSDERPVISLLPPLGRDDDRPRVQLVTGEMIVVAEMRIRRVGSIHGIDHRQAMSMPSRHRQMLAQSHSRCGGFNRLKLASNLGRSLGLHVPGVDMRGTAGQHDHDRCLGRPRGPGRFGLGRQGRLHCEVPRHSQQAGSRCRKKPASRAKREEISPAGISRFVGNHATAFDGQGDDPDRYNRFSDDRRCNHFHYMSGSKNHTQNRTGIPMESSHRSDSISSVNHRIHSSR